MSKVKSLSAQRVIDLARKETREEFEKEMVVKLKRKYRELTQAKQVVANVQREIEDAEFELTQKCGDISGTEPDA